MIPALRLTMMLMAMPATGVFALQVAPPVTPKPARPPVDTPRAELPRIKEPRDLPPRAKLWKDDMADFHFDKYDFHFDKADWKYEMPDMHFDMPDMHFDMPKMDRLMDMQVWPPNLDMKMDMKFDKFDKMDMKFDKMDMNFDKFDKFDTKLHELDMRLGEMSWKSDRFMGVTPSPGARWDRESFATSPRAAWRSIGSATRMICRRRSSHWR
jgi:hypothetical protein